jgi:hypothetical protein
LQVDVDTPEMFQTSLASKHIRIDINTNRTKKNI